MQIGGGGQGKSLGNRHAEERFFVFADSASHLAYSDAFELYDLDSDPGEHVNLASALPHLVEQLKELLPPFQDPLVHAGADTELDDSLRGLGYIGGPKN